MAMGQQPPPPLVRSSANTNTMKDTTGKSCVESPEERLRREGRSARRTPKTNAQRQQQFRQNQKEIQKRETLNSNIARKKNDAERSKRYRDRLKCKRQRGEGDLAVLRLIEDKERSDANREE